MLWKLYREVAIPKSKRSNRLGNASAIRRGRFHFAVKINFEGQGCSVKNGAAILAVAQVALDFARYFGRQPAFQVFAD